MKNKIYTLEELANTEAKRNFVKKIIRDIHKDQQIRKICGLDNETAEETIKKIFKK